ncbi:hypothetical protein MHM84_10710 [Halomonas sp. McH1-25]|uniref:hypothetical protein n=1 Tax=unclassified Halomonas TaxID=2609666 RepID=UPI001EF74E0F|nr:MULTISPECIES: hypothetical protein [unclassified Halomonas]MCG7600263.1 hypothetical protein [Halomonas sp. McH1-25]MCP1343421.1 hypothetical protein [Halomonas sp. FL8]MCP1359624.1 hypothetical protein [Halomonas sp. BBD45]MCP1366246.1 hypothetical protein [Halomonas sp. BBD48]
MARAPWIPAVAALTLSLGLAACDGGEEAQPEQSSSETSQAASETPNGVEREARNGSTQTDGDEPQLSTDNTAQDVDSAEVTDETVSSPSADVGADQQEAGVSDQQESAGGLAADDDITPSDGERLADESWEDTEDDVNEALKETERRFKEAEQELEEQFKAAEEQDVQRSQEIPIQPEDASPSQ